MAGELAVVYVCLICREGEMKFEYLVTRKAGPDLVTVQAILDKFGRDGWELVGIKWVRVPRQSGPQDSAGIFTFRRRVEAPVPIAEVRDGQLTRESALRLIKEMFKVLHAKRERDPPESKTSRAYIFPECERCWQWDHEKKCCTEMDVVSRLKGRCSHWSFSLLGAEPTEEAGECEQRDRLTIAVEKTMAHLKALREADREEIQRCSGKQPDGPKGIRPLFVDDVAVCTGGNCEQFDIFGYVCKLAGDVGDGVACPVWYKRKDQAAPKGAIHFIGIEKRFTPNLESEDNWEPLVKKVEAAMEDFTHYDRCYHSSDLSHRCNCTDNRRAVVEIALRAIEAAGHTVVKR